MPYTRPDKITRTRVTQSTPVPALAIVTFLTESPPVVDAAAYHTWCPNLDTPRPKDKFRRGGRPRKVPVDVQVPVIANKPTPAPVMAAPVVTVPVAAVAVPAVADVEQAAPAAKSAPVCIPASPEVVRTHVLDWKTRFDAIKYSIPPAGCLPRRGHKRVVVMTRGQLGESLRAHGLLEPLAINCAAPSQSPGQQPTCASTETTNNPFKTGQNSHFLAGEKGFDVEAHWRTACAQ